MRVGVLSSVNSPLLPPTLGALHDDQVGNTAHFMTEGYDEGPIITVEGYAYPKDADHPMIRCLTYKYGFDLMARTVRKVIKEGLMAHHLAPQELGQYWKPIPPEKMEEVKRKVLERRYKYMTL